MIPGQVRALSYWSGFVDDPSTYFEVLDPPERNTEPAVLMVPGGLHSAACYLTTPDFRAGWAHDFLAAGYRVILVDWPGVGRSGRMAPEAVGGKVVAEGIGRVIAELGEPVVLLTHSMSGAIGWKLIENHPHQITKVVAVAPAEPGNLGAELGVLIQEDDQRKVVSMPSGEIVVDLQSQVTVGKAFAHAKFIGSGTRFPMHAFDAYYASLLGVSGRMVFERTNIGGAQLRVDDLSSFAGKPILVVSGTDDADHPKAASLELIGWLNSVGAGAELLYLGDAGVQGNGHMLMLEDNSSDIASRIIDWLQR